MLRVWLAATLLLAACDRAIEPPAAVEANAAAAAPPLAAAAQADFPALTGRVVDNADLLRPDEEARLTERLAALERRTTDQLVIVTVPSLDGREIDDYSRDLGNLWRVGRADKDNGVLLVVAPAERRVRIEVGYGLEPILTNARSSEIIQRDILPHFREGRFREGIEAGADSIVRTLVEHEAEPRRGRS